ncbi:hypothetical protein ALP18_200305 [Pseudomonas amygdali pv. myricae]|uniref:Uncharacterized protein n=1 Tax=Pseudomonas amygdali pv. mori TaxID=34065 RepID=A0A3M5IZY6_PSEA0|nr:hypothetical protein ALP52_200030 [Pseudomonas amygdali pv. mori]RMV01843.1 hypothetical protein ALP18_200305 [Pseudomonas amygdali pv. myricae]
MWPANSRSKCRELDIKLQPELFTYFFQSTIN